MKLEPVSKAVSRKVVRGERLELILYRYQAGAVFPTHEHEAEQLTIVLAGELVFTFGDEEVRLGAGEAVLIPGGKPHGAYVPEGAETRSYNVFSPPRRELPAA